MKRDTSKIPRPRSGWRLLVACVLAVFAVGATSVARAQSISALPYDSSKLTGEAGCTAPNLAVDPGETVTVRFDLTNSLAIDTSHLVATLQTGGGVVGITGVSSALVDGSSDGGDNTGKVIHGKTGKVSFTFTAAGSCGSTITASIVLTDGATSYGTATYTIPLGTVNTGTVPFNNGGVPFTWSSTVGPAAPYPSTINVTGISGNVTKITATITGLSHTFPDDVQLLLVGPKGQKVILMADAGGGTAVSGLNLTFDDHASTALPDETVLTSGTYKTANYGPGSIDQGDSDVFQDPAPQPPYNSSLTAFEGQDPNGTWQLFVNDDNFNDTGSISGGWSLNVSTSSTSCDTCATLPTIAVSDTSASEDTAGSFVIGVTDDTTPPQNLVVTLVSSSNPSVVPAGNVTIGTTVASGPLSGNSTVTIAPVTNKFGFSDLTFRVTDKDGLFKQATMRFTFTSVNDLPTISSISTQSTAVSTATGPIAFTVGDIETAADSLQLFADSSDKTVVPNGNIVISTTGVNRTVNITPATGQTGLTVITLTVVDADGGTATSSFTLLVGPQPLVPFISDLTIVVGGSPVVVSSFTTNEDSALPQFSFTVADAQTASKDIVVTASSSNEGLISSSSLVIGPSPATGAGRTLNATLNANQFGVTTITISARDTDGNVGTKTFQITVISVNDAPSLAINPLSKTVNENTAAAITLTVDDVESGTALSITATSDNQALIPNSNIGISNSGGTRTLTALPLQNQNGTAHIHVVVSDGTDSTTGDITITVVAVNDPPSFTIPSDITVNEDSGAYSKAFLTNISGGPGETQVVHFNVSNSNNPLFSAQPAIANDGTLTFTPAADANGVATVSVVAVDDGAGTGGTPASSAAKNFVITVIAVNDAPSFTAGPSPVTVTQDQFSTTPYSNAWATAISPGPANESTQTVSFVVVNNNNGLFTVQPTITPTGQLFFLTAPKKAGNATVSVRLVDNGGTANGGKDTTPDASLTAVTFAITVTDTPDAPTFSGLLATYSTTKNVTSPAILFTVNDPDTADQNQVTVTGASSDQSIVQDSSILIGANGGTRAMTITPVTDAIGTVTITLTAKNVDSSGNPQGVNTTTTFTFKVENKNAPPTITLPNPSGLTVLEDSQNITYNVTVSDLETPANLITVTATSDNQGVVPNSNIFVANGAGGARTLIITPAANSNGVVNITINATDTAIAGPPALAAVTSSATFKLTITPVNDPPVIVGLPSKTSTTEDTTLNLTFTATDVDDATTNLVFSLSSTNTAVVANSGLSIVRGVNGTNVLVISPVTNASGLTRIDITVNDGESANNSATTSILLTVLEVNDPPIISGYTDQVHGEDENFSFTFNISDVETTQLNKMFNSTWADPAVTTHQVFATILSDTNGVLASAVLDNGAGFTNNVRKVVVTVASHKSGHAVIDLQVTDLGDVQTAPGQPDNQLAPQTSEARVNVDINFINHAPTITPIASLTIAEDSPTPPLAFIVNDIETAAGNLIITGTSSDQTVVANSGILFNGTAGNRTVIVNPVKDANGTATITVAVSDGALTNATTFVVTVTPVNDQPVVGPIADQTTLENVDTQLIRFTVSDAETPAGSLVVHGTSSVQSVVPDQNIFFGGSGGDRALIITPARNASGVTFITVTADDGATNSAPRTFKLTVTGVNNAPTISSIPDQTVDQGKTLTGIAFIVGDIETPAPFLVTSGTSSNPTLVPNDSIFLGGSSSNRTMAIVPAAGKSGTATITVKVTDDGGLSATTTFGLTVKAVNQAPVIGPISNQTVAENTTLGPIPFSVSDSDSSSFTVSATSSTQAVVPDSGIALGGSGGNRSITITPASNQSGSTTITITATDDQNASSSASFTVTVTHVNQKPTITTISNQTTKEGVAVAVNFSINDAETAAANLTLTGTSSNPGLLPNGNITFPPSSGQIRTVTLAPVTGQSGTSTVTVTVTDADNGSASTSFTLTVSSVNRNDFNGDGLSDIIFENSDGFLAVWFMNRTNQIGNSFLNPSGTGDPRWKIVGSGDFNGDNQGDLLFQHQDGTLAVWFMNGTNLVSAKVLNPSSPGDARWHVAATADVNRDGQRDILFQHEDGSLAVWYMNGTTLVSGTLLNPAKVDPQWHLSAAGDFNGDGDADLIFQNSTTRDLAVWYMHGSVFSDSELLNPFDPLPGWHVVGSADYNGDGQADLIFQNDSGALEAWFMKGPNGVERPFLNPVSAGAGWKVVAPK